MLKKNTAKKVMRRVWRMTAENPRGEFVIPSEVQSPPPAPRDFYEPGLRESSEALGSGLALTELEINTLPGELIDELLKGRG